MSMMVSFVLFFFPRGVLGEILNLIGSVSGVFPSYFCHLGTASNEITVGLQLVCGRSTLALSSALIPQTLSCLVCVEDS